MTDEQIIETEPNLKSVEVIAELGWQTHIAWEDIIREDQKPYWSDLSSDQRAAIVESVRWLIEHPTSSIAAQHDAWRARKAGEGWNSRYENNGDKQHPNMVEFDELPFSQQMKARLWRHIIFAVLG